jgi:cell division protein FtsN
MKIINYCLILITIMFYACASSHETTQTQQIPKKEPEVYIFDDAGKIDTAKVEKPKEVVKEPVSVEKKETNQPVTKKFIVQVGAFTSKERAQIFINENKTKIEQLMSITFRDQDKLWLVQLPAFSSREEAEKVRNSIWQIPSFKDAFIITSE